MSASRVLSAAAALREFDLDQVAAFCDEPRDVIVAVLSSVSGCLQPVGDSGDRWRVLDQAELRRRSRALDPGAQPQVVRRTHRSNTDVTEIRLDYAAQTLLECDQTRPYEERRLQFVAATNALRQAVAALRSTSRPWWQLDVSPESLDAGTAEVDAVTLTRLRLTGEVAYLTKQDLIGHPLDTHDLVAAARRLLDRTRGVDLASMYDLVARFVDLVLLQAAPTPDKAAPGRLLSAVARGRVRARVESSVSSGLNDLVPLLENIGGGGEPAPRLYQELEDLPAGCKRIVVYTDLLELLPQQFRYRAGGCRLPGALIEAFTDPDTTVQLRTHASWLEQDLVRSPYGSDRALIGSAVHMLQQMTEQDATVDLSLRTRSDALCSELNRLAMVRFG
jgi:hypothetical protein